MGKRPTKSKPTWADVKNNLASFDRAALLGVLQDLYAADEANRAFLHTRFGLGADPLQPYKRRPLIDACGRICPGDSERLYLERRRRSPNTRKRSVILWA
jgi:hypothetical protein